MTTMQARSRLTLIAAIATVATVLVAAVSSRGLAQSSPAQQYGLTVQTSSETRALAERLLQEIRAGIGRFAHLSAAQAEGYQQTTPYRFGHWGPAHFNNIAFQRDGRFLEPARPEALVYLKTPDDRVVLLGAMFLAPKGQGPRPAGPLMEWHVHDNLCVTSTGTVALATGPGQCPAGSFFVGEGVEMMHVWIFDHPEGAFAHALSPAAIRAAMKYATHR